MSMIHTQTLGEANPPYQYRRERTWPAFYYLHVLTSYTLSEKEPVMSEGSTSTKLMIRQQTVGKTRHRQIFTPTLTFERHKKLLTTKSISLEAPRALEAQYRLSNRMWFMTRQMITGLKRLQCRYLCLGTLQPCGTTKSS